MTVLFYKNAPDCLIAPTWCPIPASPVFPNPNDYTPLVTLTLPRGDFLVTGKLSAFANNGTSYVNFECALVGSTAATPIDFSSFDGTAEQTLFLQAPFHAGRGGGTVTLGCRAFGFQWDGVTLVDMRVWNASVAAVRVATAVVE